GLARLAFDQKRTKDCLDFTRAILLIDPDNPDALRMRSSVQSQMQRDLQTARDLLRRPQVSAIPETKPAASNTAGNAESRVEEEPQQLPPGPSTPDPKRRVLYRMTIFVVLGIMFGLTAAVALTISRNTSSAPSPVAQPVAPAPNASETPKPPDVP